MNKVSLAIPERAGAAEKPGPKPPVKGQSHIRQARPAPAPKVPEAGPMAAMLKRLFGDKG
jgi:PTH1 family peptidyl-tRNA hydrolase